MSSVTASSSSPSCCPLRTELYAEALEHWPGSSQAQKTQARAATTTATSTATASSSSTTTATATATTSATNATTTATSSSTTCTNEAKSSTEDEHESKARPVKVILAQYDSSTIVVYQAFNPTIAAYAVKHQRFTGCPAYDVHRMTWIKTNFLWMMFRAGWATKPNQERILAITITHDFFHHLLSLCIPSSYQSHLFATQQEYDKVVAQAKNSKQGFCRLQWDPDHTPSGGIVGTRRAIQIGMKGVTFADGNGIVRIDDITEFVTQQYQHVLNNTLSQLVIPVERVFPIAVGALADRICVDHVDT